MMRESNIRFIVLLIFTFGISNLTKSQELPNLDSLIKDDMKINNYIFNESRPNSWKDVEKVILFCVDTLLKTQNINTDRNRNKISGFVLEYSSKGPYKFPIEDNLANELMKIDSEIWTYYIYGMVNYYLKNNQKEHSIEDIQLHGLQIMLEYISNDKNLSKESSLNYNNVKESKFLNKLQSLKQNEKLIQIIKNK